MVEFGRVLLSAGWARVRGWLDSAGWIAGNATSGHQSALAKRNMQLPEDSAAARQAGEVILKALAATPMFIAAAFPLKVFQPLFNSYAGGQAFATHIHSALPIQSGSDFRVRSDLPATLFRGAPRTYACGELSIEADVGVKQEKLDG